jgi:aromatic ring-opening dioxygenase catalytic subunit (LigB family)
LHLALELPFGIKTMSGDEPKATLNRRDALGLMFAAAAAPVAACTSEAERPPVPLQKSPIMNQNQSSTRMPVVYLPHGGGPWPFVDLGGFVDQREIRALADYLRGLPAQLPQKPTALVVVSAHWEGKVPTVMTNPQPSIFYDYYGFPPESYEIQWPAPGNPQLAARVRTLLEQSGIQSAEDAQRGFDHGTFIPLKLTFPDADVPTIQLSLQLGLDPEKHLAMGRALAPLRDEGVLLVGSGMSYHNMRDFRNSGALSVSEVFDAWLRQTSTAESKTRDTELTRWSSAPQGRRAHPREEHLLPLMVMAGAAGADPGRITYSDTFAGVRISAVHFGA